MKRVIFFFNFEHVGVLLNLKHSRQAVETRLLQVSSIDDCGSVSCWLALDSEGSTEPEREHLETITGISFYCTSLNCASQMMHFLIN